MTQLVFDLPHRTALGREDFLVAEGNEEAVAWLDKWPDWPRVGRLPAALVIHGPAGCGKTHLASVWQTVSAARFIDAAAIMPDAVPELLRDADAVVLDDLTARIDEHGLFHLLNLLGERGGSLLITAAEPPARWAIALPDLKSRLSALPSVGLGVPDEALLAAVMVKLFADRQLMVSQELVQFLLPRIERSFAAVRDIVDRLDRAALASRRNITVPLARSLLALQDEENDMEGN
ncbi:MAG: DNA replication protein [Alphaproteobacteria bacterium]|nr:DNA replication protein [Alphaproteobacteria bacterium]MBU0797848.1 DNA replication protein [Alphaproteobacteria bacterium]MBU0886705.1 DNA replication protein [Alphaproteobacteria bacterium]MBU1814560.1 DNA replication protein [Alphaproteobacteria bacterium]